MQELEHLSLGRVRTVANTLYNVFEDDIGLRGDRTVKLAGVALFVSMVLEEMAESTQTWDGSGVSFKELSRLFVVLLDVVP